MYFRKPLHLFLNLCNHDNYLSFMCAATTQLSLRTNVWSGRTRIDLC